MYERGELIEMTISSRVPAKWRFVDLETGDVWRWRLPDDPEGAGSFIRADGVYLEG